MTVGLVAHVVLVVDLVLVGTVAMMALDAATGSPHRRRSGR